MKKTFLPTLAILCALAISGTVFARDTPPGTAGKATVTKPAAPPPAKAAPQVSSPKPALAPGPVAKSAPPPVLKSAPVDGIGKSALPVPQSVGQLTPTKPSFDSGAAAALKSETQRLTMQKAEADRVAAAAAKREADAAIARAQASSRFSGAVTTPSPTTRQADPQHAADQERIRRLEQSNRALRSDNRDLRIDERNELGRGNTVLIIPRTITRLPNQSANGPVSQSTTPSTQGGGTFWIITVLLILAVIVGTVYWLRREAT